MLGGFYLACELANGVLYMLERVFKLAIRHDVLIVGSNIHKTSHANGEVFKSLYNLCVLKKKK